MNATVAAAAAALVVGMGAGHAAGAHHPGKVLVPEAAGAPADLPGWACRELVENRVRDMREEIESDVARADALSGKEPVLGLAAHAYLSADLGVCPAEEDW